MAMTSPIEYEHASPQVRQVFDDIMQTRKIDKLNNFWKYLANDPKTLARTWSSIKEIMAPDGALSPAVKEIIYLAVSVSNNCPYCVASHTAAAYKAGMTDEMFAEMMAIVGMANETNRLVAGYRVPIDEAYQP
ncbi:carboxymuconolactone decarboxylase family protein [Allopusillimonas ginsengisoli]|uniref:carboxymuconolactone decarboxylase family protein n=1 Tax=Allopusillimonas ginsengisoli TaxID=453575 RepID=UPI001021FBC5|nr:carboxymuconolactone decarboxylase family protein [Allopusillimonas ginsengisoli]TEA79049.1 carboxymuconolactone decarboxylase family protein [Allopusillimonas ginsengisoli]